MKFKIFLLFNLSLGFVLLCCDYGEGEPFANDTFQITLRTTQGKVIKDKKLEYCSTEISMD